MEAMEGESAGSEGQGGSTEQLQRSLHELLERHGVMQELRAHLRSHLVALIKSSQTGESLVCKELLSQRLDLKFQALNIIIIEYLMRQEFSYTLSVFASEIPLANMVFHFARSLVDRAKRGESTDIRFDADDIWHILHGLGVTCDAEHAGRVVAAYGGARGPPLLLCLLQARLCRDDVAADRENGTAQAKTAAGVCPHRAQCDTCRTAERDNLAGKKKHFVQDLSDVRDVDPRCSRDARCGLGEVTAAEMELVDEMFQQLKSVYEAETETLRGRQDRRLQLSLASCRAQLHEKESELEEEYRIKREALEQSVEDRKRFLWQLARSLRQQHADLTEAVRQVQEERQQLNRREESLKEQLKIAEDILKKNSEEMREQLSQELKILERHLDTMRVERDTITRERGELERLKEAVPNQSDEVKTEFEEQKRLNENLQRHYDNIKDELSVVKNYIAATTLLKPKCFVETSSLTDICGVNNNFYIVLNNEEGKRNATDVSNSSCSLAHLAADKDNVPMNNSSATKIARNQLQLINDLTKFKNVNFINDAVVQVNMESTVGVASSAVCNMEAQAGELLGLRMDKTALRAFADQDLHTGLEHIRGLQIGQATLRAELASAQHIIDNMSRLAAFAAPVVGPVRPPRPRVANTPYACGQRACFEELERGAAGQGAADVPPFRTPQRDSTLFRPVVSCSEPSKDHVKRASLQSPWSRMRPIPARFKSRYFRPRPHDAPLPRPASGSSIPHFGSTASSSAERLVPPQRKSFYGEYEKVTPKDYGEQETKTSGEVRPDEVENEGDISPTVEMLSAAKKRLRKLEIEAEAVEKSYREFRSRRSELDAVQPERRSKMAAMTTDSLPSVDIQRSSLLFGEGPDSDSENVMFDDVPSEDGSEIRGKDEFKRYLTEYERQHSSIEIGKPKLDSVCVATARIYHDDIKARQSFNENNLKGKLVEKPLTEFRKLYQAEHIHSPTARINKALQALRSNEKSLNGSRENHLLPTRVMRSKSTDHLSDAKLAALQLINKRPPINEDKSGSKLTETQKQILISNIKKIYNIECTLTSNGNAGSDPESNGLKVEPNKCLVNSNCIKNNNSNSQLQKFDIEGGTEKHSDAKVIPNGKVDEAGIQTDKEEYKKPTSILVLVESKTVEEAPLNTPEPSQNVFTNPTDNVKNLLKNNPNVTDEFSEKCSLQAIPDKTSTSNVNLYQSGSDTTLTDVNLKQLRSDTTLTANEIKISTNQVNVITDQYAENQFSSNEDPVTCPPFPEDQTVIEKEHCTVVEAKKTEPLEIIMNNTGPIKKLDDYSSEDFSINTTASKLDNEDSPISVGKSEVDSFWE